MAPKCSQLSTEVDIQNHRSSRSDPRSGSLYISKYYERTDLMPLPTKIDWPDHQV